MKIRPTGKEAKFKRHMHRAGRRAQVAIRKADRAAHLGERHTIASHLRTMGVDDKTATRMAATLRKHITPGVKGIALKDGVRRRCTRYTRSQTLAALGIYNPRNKDLKVARTALLALAA